MRSGFALLTAMATFTGCGLSDSRPASGSLTLNTAALTLPGVDRVCYDLEVRAGPDASAPLVWSRADVCSDRYGNRVGGGVSYVGTCDASAGMHRVEIRLTGLFRGGAPLNDWVPPPAFVRADVPCITDADTAVLANFVVMRSAQQGFLDLAVDFDQIACSAKVDCQSGSETLLHDAGSRADTVVVALSCSDGDGQPPHLMMDDVVITCGDRTVAIDPSRGPGRFTDYADPSGITFGAQSHEGTHSGGSYWTVALGLDTISPPAPCTLTTRMTATRDDAAGDLAMTTFTTYPIIDVHVQLGTQVDGTFNCGNLGLDAEDPDSPSWVRTVYLDRATTDEPFGAPFVACFDPALPPDHTSPCASGLLDPIDASDTHDADTSDAADTLATADASGSSDTTSADSSPSGAGPSDAGPPTDTTDSTPTLAPPPTLREIALGTDHACAIMSGGSLACWGDNGAGQFIGKLGNGAGAGTFRVPSPVQGLSAPAASLSAGARHTCVVLESGHAFCWGDDGQGQVGNGVNSGLADDSVATPDEVVGLDDATSIATGLDHTCAATTTGAVWCWGGNSYSQLGAQGFPAYVPRGVAGVADVTEVVATDNGTCALRVDHSVWCWGEHFGNGPAPFTGLSDVAELATGGDRLCVVRASGQAACWQAGQPEVLTLDQVVDLDVSQGHACAVRQGGSVWCWGDNAKGQLGDGTTTASSTPIEVPSLTGLTRVSVGGETTCARNDDGQVWCWGRNDHGQLGLGTQLDHTTPQPMDVLAIRPRQLSIGSGGCARLGHGHVDCWGSGVAGFGLYVSGEDSVAGVVLDPIAGSPTPPLASVTEVAAGGVACARFDDGSVRCAGASQYGQLGDGSSAFGTRFTTVLGLGSAVAIRVGGTHACALLSDRTATCWGRNDVGQLGDGTLTNRRSPVPVRGLSDLVDLATGSSHTCALNAQGEVFCWGTRSLAGGGAAPTGHIKLPMKVPNLTNIVQIDINQGGSFTCARGALGRVSCWGLNGSGQLGDGTTTNSVSPRQVPNLSSVVDLGVGTNFVTVALADGTVACWGSSNHGRCGSSGNMANGAQSVTLAPVIVPGVSDVIEVAAGGHACARRTDHTVWCWGSALPIGAVSGWTATPTLALFR